jgi:hypothetical protein
MWMKKTSHRRVGKSKVLWINTSLMLGEKLLCAEINKEKETRFL